MNREIKFRCWDIKSKKYRYDYVPVIEEWWDSDCWDDSEDALEEPYTYFKATFTHRLIWQQYTGVKDSTGKEVYEGDILLYDSHSSPCVVRWTREDEDNHPGFSMNDLYSQYGPYKVIGNIYENPELLKWN